MGSRWALVAMVMVLSACAGDGSPDVCEPDIVYLAGDLEAAGHGIEVWALPFATYPMTTGQEFFVPRDEEIKIVWRSTGEGYIEFRAIGPDGSVVVPVWGPDGHLGSSWDTHPGEEWGTGWVFDQIGCWSIEITRGNAKAYLDVDIRA